MESLKKKLQYINEINKNIEIQISKLFDKLLKFNEQNHEKFYHNLFYQNIFKNLNIINPNLNSLIKLEKIEEISDNFAELSLCLIEEIDKLSKNIYQYQSINSECDQLKIEILELKKSYSNKKMEIEKEKEKLISEFQKNKTEEFNKINFDYQDRISTLETLNSEKDEAIEKLNNDNTLLYSQYLLSEKNFEEYKNNRKEYE